MADKQGWYWNHEECSWVRCPSATQIVEIPEQQTAVEAEAEADVRSG